RCPSPLTGSRSNQRPCSPCTRRWTSWLPPSRISFGSLNCASLPATSWPRLPRTSSTSPTPRSNAAGNGPGPCCCGKSAETSMTPDQERRVHELLDAALMQETAARAAFVAEACPDDPLVRSEVVSLLRHCERAEAHGFLEAPAASTPPRPGVEDVQGQLFV